MITEKARALLLKLVASYDNDGQNDFNYLFYREFGTGVIDELAALSCVVKMNDYAGRVKLTCIGYDLAMEMLK